MTLLAWLRAAKAPIVPAPWRVREVPFKSQFLRVIARQCSNERSNSAEELHQDWMNEYRKMGWIYGPEYDTKKKTHPDLVPYAQLAQKV